MATPATTWTIRALIAWTTKYLSEKGIESPRLEAELLLAHALDCKRIDLIVRFEEEPDEKSKAAFRELVKRRAERWPTAYLIGTREFFLLPFDVSPAVLIPRPDTETLVAAVLEVLTVKPSAKVLDVGTGSGCIAVSLAHKVPAAHVTAVDLSPDALDTAKANAAKLGVVDRLRFLQGDLFAPLNGDTFDVIVSNPPYVTTSEMATLQPEVRDHEPRTALDGGPDGLAFYRRLADGGAKHLNPGGTMMVEIGAGQEAAVKSIFESAGWTGIKSLKDAAGIARVVMAKRG